MSDHDIETASPDDPLRTIHGLANTLRQWRTALRWSQEALAGRSGVSQKTISAIETGDVPTPQDRTLSAIATAIAAELDMDAKALLRDLERAREYHPTEEASPFARRLDGLLQGHNPMTRVFLEEVILNFYFATIKALDFARHTAKKKKNRSSE